VEIISVKASPYCDLAAERGTRALQPRAITLSIPVTSHACGAVVIPVVDAEQRCESARGHAVRLFACTEARRAIAITRTGDRRDTRYLTGANGDSGYAVYCGGMDAAIARALIYAQWADVVCYASADHAFAEALQFSESIRREFPEKLVGFAYRAHPTRVDVRAVDHVTASRMLHRLGYDYYLHSSANESEATARGSWTFVDDAA
jgi:isocitrate lyase